MKIRHLWWSAGNWFRGLKFGPIARCRICEHTTPYHYNGCRNG